MDITTVFIIGASLTALMGLTWAAAARLANPESMLRGPAVWWASANLLLCAGMTVGAWREALVAGGAYAVPLSILLALSFAAMRWGWLEFTGENMTIVQDLAIVLAAMGLALYTLNLGGTRDRAAAELMVGVTYLVLRSALSSLPQNERTYSKTTGRVAVCLLALVGGLYALRAMLLAAADRPGPGVLAGKDGFYFLLSVVLEVLPLNLGFAAIIVSRLMNEAQRLSLQDHLTGLANRRQLEQVLKSEITRSRRSESAFTVMMVDIDHFKAVNDTYGHPGGDEVLVSVARTLSRTARQADIVGRMGGEEFCVILPETIVEGAARAAERLRFAVEHTNVMLHGTPVSITVSIGVATFFKAEEEWGDLLSRADKALYRAKIGGRNRVEVSIWPDIKPTDCKSDANLGTPKSQAEDSKPAQNTKTTAKQRVDIRQGGRAR